MTFTIPIVCAKATTVRVKIKRDVVGPNTDNEYVIDNLIESWFTRQKTVSAHHAI